MTSRKTVLIVEDNLVSRRLLRQILQDDYDVLEAENGREGLECLRNQGDRVKAVVLDLVMPIMDGYSFLSEVRGEAEGRSLPIIVFTGAEDGEAERRALQLGAWDFVPKPYEPEILKFRLKNAIERSQIALFHQLKYITEFDPMTGIYQKAKFFAMTRAMLCAGHAERFAFFRMDIERFQLVNSFYGTQTGNRLLKFMAQRLRETVSGSTKGTYGRMEADVFAACISCPGEREAIKFVER